jgi:hypothetical protein
MEPMATNVEPRLRWLSPGRQPNGLQATADGLWVIDQIDPNDLYLLAYEDGRQVSRLPIPAMAIVPTASPGIRTMPRCGVSTRTGA